MADTMAGMRRELDELKMARDASERIAQALDTEHRDTIQQLQSQVHFAVAWIQQVDRQLSTSQRSTPQQAAPVSPADASGLVPDDQHSVASVSSSHDANRLPPAPPMRLRQEE